MAEPTTTTGAGGAALVAIAASLVGSKYGPLATVAVAALIGAFISLGEVGTAGGRLGGVRYIVLYTLTGALTAGAVSYLIERFTQVPAIEILVLVAFCIGWIGGRWQGILNSALSAGQVLLGRAAPERGGKRK